MWILRLHSAIRLPLSLVYDHTTAGVPFVMPEIVVPFKSSDPRAKDELDFSNAGGSLTAERRARLVGWLRQVRPQHRWIHRLDA